MTGIAQARDLSIIVGIVALLVHLRGRHKERREARRRWAIQVGIAIMAVIATTFAAIAGETVTGHPRIVDADTLAFGKERVRIEGIDAPETRQNCRDAAGRTYACGKAATAALRARVAGEPVTCRGDEKDRYGRLIGFCFFADGASLNGWVVRQGHALAYRKYSKRYIQAEAAAKAEGLGIWAGEFVPPWKWRRGVRLAP